MEMMRIVAAALTGVFLAAAIKKQAPAISLCVGLITSVLLLFMVLDAGAKVVEAIRALTQKSGLATGYAAVIFRVVAVSYLARFAIDICEDAGEKAIAGQVDLGAKLLIAAMALPILMAVLDMVERMLS